MENNSRISPLHLVIITGLSGAGKSQTVNCLEDLGYYCVDNLPPALVGKFIELSLHSEGAINKVALVIDIRGGEFFRAMDQVVAELKSNGVEFKIIYLEASDEVLIRRFKESRRPHPLAQNESLLEAIGRERRLLEKLRGDANLIIDTSDISPQLLREKLNDIFREGDEGLTISVASFGFKSGIPIDSDIVIDVRFLPNPYYDPEMKYMTGRDQPVIDYVMNSPVTQEFCQRFTAMLDFLIPNYINEGKTNLAIAVGCTGGQHRSVVIARYTAEHLMSQGHNVFLRHRDMAKNKLKAVYVE